jgi:hypothetical protein
MQGWREGRRKADEVITNAFGASYKTLPWFLMALLADCLFNFILQGCNLNLFLP